MANGAVGRVGKAWTRDDDRQLRTLAEAGRSKAEIAAMLGRTLCGVGSRASAMRVPLMRPPVSWGKPFSAEEDQALRDLIAAGTRRYTCARRMQRSARDPHQRATELGVHLPPHRPHGRVGNVLEAARAEWIGGASGGDIARRHGGGLTRSAVIAKMHRLGLGNIRGATNRARPSRGKPNN